MNLTIIEKSILPLLFSTLLVGAFYWQFTSIYPYIIQHFTEDKLSILYAHLFIYSFLSYVIFITISNLLNHYFIQSKLFLILSITIIFIFYGLTYTVYYDIVDYFINFPLSNTALMGAILFIVGTFCYALYSIFLTLFNRTIPLSHIVIFTLLALFYAIGFIDTYCYPISEIRSKFS